MLIPLIVFILLLYFARSELGWKYILFFLAIVAGLVLGAAYSPSIKPQYITIGICLIDIILILVIFKGDIRIN